MKFSLLIVALIIGSSVTEAQSIYFFDDFSSGDLNKWTAIDGEGDGRTWSNYDNWQSEKGQCAISISKLRDPDDWLITEAITIPTVADIVSLEWKARARDGFNPSESLSETYSVYIGETSSIDDVNQLDLIFEDEVTDDLDLPDFFDRQIDISAYAGKTIHVFFRHNNVDGKTALMLDEISVRRITAKELELVSFKIPPVVDEGPVGIAGIVKNNGSETVTSFNITWDNGSGKKSKTISGVTISQNAIYEFSEIVVFDAERGEDYNIEVCVDLQGDAEISNDCLAGFCSAVSENVDKYTVGFKKTGTWCGACPKGYIAMEQMEAYPNFIGVAVHSAPMFAEGFFENINKYMDSGFPSANVDNVLRGSPGSFLNMHNERLNSKFPPPASLGVRATVGDETLTVEVSADFVATLNDEVYALGFCLVEDNVTGTDPDFAQANFYHGNPPGSLVGAGQDWGTAGNPVPASEMEYDHVARATGPGLMGYPKTLPTNLERGSRHSYVYEVPLNPEWNIENCYLVGMFSNSETGEILNAGKSKAFEFAGLTDNISDFEISIYPNPVSEIASITFNIDEPSDVKITLYSADGKVKYMSEKTSVNEGTHAFNVDVSSFSKGIFFVETTINESQVLKKILVH